MGTLKFRVDTSGMDALKERIARAGSKAETTVAVQVEKDTEPYVPMLTGSLKNRTYINGNEIVYPGPYARYLYYGKVMVNAATGKGPMHFVDKNGNEVIRFPAGSHLEATDRDLKYTKYHHKDAQSHWFEASKAQNLEKWVGVAEKAVKMELGK